MARANLPRPCLMLVTEPMERSRLVDVVREAVAGGVNIVQLRDKTAKGPELLDTAFALKEGIGDCPLLVNMRPTIASHADLAGVHLPGNGLRIDTVRAIIGPDRLIGRSIHGSSDPVAAGGDGADYLIVGTVFASRSHEDIFPAGTDAIRHVREALQQWFASDLRTDPSNWGTELLFASGGRRVPPGCAGRVPFGCAGSFIDPARLDVISDSCLFVSARRDRRESKNPRAANLPIIAIGGITSENCEECLAAGASGVAVLSGILHAADPRAAARKYWERLIAYSAG